MQEDLRMATKALSQAQIDIFNLWKTGLTAEKIAKKLHITNAVVKAQMTRIRGKGIDVQNQGTPLMEVFAAEADSKLISQVEGALGQAQKVGDKAEQLQSMGSLPDLEHRLRTSPNAERYARLGVHPFLQFDLVVKFVKLFGGRDGAHQAIEDVFDSIRDFLGVKDPPRVDGESVDG